VAFARIQRAHQCTARAVRLVLPFALCFDGRENDNAEHCVEQIALALHLHRSAIAEILSPLFIFVQMDAIH
jgi:hypothetical protein